MQGAVDPGRAQLVVRSGVAEQMAAIGAGDKTRLADRYQLEFLTDPKALNRAASV